MIPSYFDYTLNKDRTITLYHGMRDDSFEKLILDEKLIPKASSDAPKMLWFSSKLENSYTKDYRNIVSIDIPIKFFEEKRFRPENSIDVTTIKSVSLNDFKFKLLKICNFDWINCKENLYKIYNEKLQKINKLKNKENPDDLLYSLFERDSFVYLVKNWMYMYENYTLKHKKWNYIEYDYNKNLIL